MFYENFDFVTTFNRVSQGFELALNEFADIPHSHFVETRCGFDGSRLRKSRSTYGQVMLAFNNRFKYDDVDFSDVKEIPASLDYRQQGIVSEVKNQGQCGSCWAFSANGALEAALAKKARKNGLDAGSVATLSEQQLVDCSRKFGNEGCRGGLMDLAYQYILEAGGIESDKTYPYTGHDGVCHANNASFVPGAKLVKYLQLAPGNETAIQLALIKFGPVAVAIDASQMTFQFYKSGVYDGHCGSKEEELNHAVLIVGYGHDSASNKPYWIVKNSWGASWGDRGYIKMLRSANQCGIADYVSIPVV